MSTAVLISGQARSFGGTDQPIPGQYPAPMGASPEEKRRTSRAQQPWAKRTFENQCWYLYRQLKDMEFFVSLADDEFAKEVEPLLLSRYPREKVHVEIVTQPTLPEPQIQACFHSGYSVSAPPQSILRDLWHRKRVWEFYKETLGAKHGVPSDMTRDILGLHRHFVRLRPDSYFQKVALPTPPHYLPDACSVPYWSSFGGVNDRFAIVSRSYTAAYFGAFDAVEGLVAKGCPFHPETLLAAALEAARVPINNRLPVHFFTLRRNGDVIPMTLEESVIAYADLAVGAL